MLTAKPATNGVTATAVMGYAALERWSCPGFSVAANLRGPPYPNLQLTMIDLRGDLPIADGYRCAQRHPTKALLSPRAAKIVGCRGAPNGPSLARTTAANAAPT
jgi:hypothetical protein